MRSLPEIDQRPHIAQVLSLASSQGWSVWMIQSLENVSQINRKKFRPKSLIWRLRKLWRKVSFWHSMLLSLITIYLGQVQAPDADHRPSIIRLHLILLRPHLLPSFLKFQSQQQWLCLGICVFVCTRVCVCVCTQTVPSASNVLLARLDLTSRAWLLKSVALQLQHPRGLLEIESHQWIPDLLNQNLLLSKIPGDCTTTFL